MSVFIDTIFNNNGTLTYGACMTKKIILISLMIIGINLNSFAETDFPKKELLRFKINVFGIHVGFQDMILHGIKNVNGKKLLYATASTRSIPAIEKSFNYILNDVIHVWMDPKTFLPLKIIKNIHEGNWKNKVIITINQKEKTALYKDKRNLNGIKIKFKKPVLDIVSMIYFVRKMKSEIGKKISVEYLSDKKNILPVTLIIEKAKKIKMGKGTLSTLLYKQIGGHNIRIRITDDKYHIPLNITVGAFEVYGYRINIVGNLIKVKRNNF